MKYVALRAALACLVVTGHCLAQEPGNRGDRPVDAAARAEVIDALSKALNERYVFPDVAKQMEKSVRDRAQRGEYNGLTTANAFAKALTEHIRDVSRDKHLVLNYSP